MTFAIDVAIPAHNEELLIARTLKSLNRQATDQAYSFHFTVVANACKDATAEVARKTIAELEVSKNLFFDVIETPEPGKNRAINKVLRDSTSDIFMYADADVTFSSNCFMRTAKILTETKAVASGAIPRLIIPENRSLEMKAIYRARQLYDELSGMVPVPIGRMLGFNRSIIQKLPENVASEDRFITLSVSQRFGWQTVQVAMGAYVYAIAPANENDFICQTARDAAGAKQLFSLYPQLEGVKRIAMKERQRNTLPKSEVDYKVKLALKREGFDPQAIDKLHDMLERGKYIGESQSGIISEQGLWQPIASTKIL